MNGIPFVLLNPRRSLAEREPVGGQERCDWRERTLGPFELDKVQAAV